MLLKSKTLFWQKLLEHLIYYHVRYLCSSFKTNCIDISTTRTILLNYATSNSFNEILDSLIIVSHWIIN